MKRILAIMTLSLCAFLLIGSSASAAEENVYRCHGNSSMKIALTFDDGPHPRYTPQILSILEKYDVRATFFLIGENITRYPEVAAAILAAGHEIGNHTFSHKQIKHYDEEQLRNEMERCEEVIYEISEYHPKLFRPPQGTLDQKVKTLSEQFDYKVILWNIDTRDWDHATPEAIKENVIQNVEAGSIILMHDYVSYNSPTPEALELFLPRLLEEGYTFVVVSDLLGSE